MSIFLTDLLAFFQTFGYPALWLSVFIAALGAPLPIALALLAAGAFAALGDFNIFLLIAITITASVAGDNIGYLVGRKWGSRLLNWLQSRPGARLLSPRAIEKSRIYFNRGGGWAIFLSRFLVAALGGIINLIAGSELFPYRSFLICDFAGETIGAVMPLVLGFAFGASWEAVGDVLGSLSFLVLAALATLVLFTRLLKNLRRSRLESIAREEHKSEEQHLPGMATVIDPPRPSSGPLPLS